MTQAFSGQPTGSSKYDVIPPTVGELTEIADRYGMTFRDDEMEYFAEVIKGTIDSYKRVGALPEPKPEVKYPRTPGYRPAIEDNPLNAWYWRCSIEGSGTGKMAGKTVALKDNICVAGVPMMNGSAIVEGFVPDVDATIVTRMLDEGAEIIGKAVCENLCLSGGSNTAATGPVLNPHNPKYSAGGSSSGSGALVVNGDCDIAIGGDQGGSIRIPSALCGAYGLKATYGLVPYTGIFPLENTVDHAGPMCTSTADVALVLEVIAGKDPLDPRQNAAVPEHGSVRYTEALTGDVKDLRFGIVTEGFGWEGVDRDTDEIVKEAAWAFQKLGANVKEVSIPMHPDGIHIFTPVLVEGGLVQVVKLNGFGMGWKGWYNTSAIDFFGKSWKAMPDSFSDTVKQVILLGEYMLQKYQGRYYARAQNQVMTLREEYDKALSEVDVLLMPTCAPEGKAQPHVDNPTAEDIFRIGFRHHWNTASFDMTGHPSLTIPCGKSDGLPVGLLLTGRHFEDGTLLRAAHAFESMGLYK